MLCKISTPFRPKSCLISPHAHIEPKSLTASFVGMCDDKSLFKSIVLFQKQIYKTKLVTTSRNVDSCFFCSQQINTSFSQLRLFCLLVVRGGVFVVGSARAADLSDYYLYEKQSRFGVTTNIVGGRSLLDSS